MIIQSILARIGIVLVLVVLAFGGGWLRGHNRGWDSATAHYTKVVSACMAANDRDAQTIRNLEAANREWADAAKADAAKLSQAAADVAAMKASGDKAVAESQRKLQEVEHANQDNRVWAAGRVPAAVSDSLRH